MGLEYWYFVLVLTSRTGRTWRLTGLSNKAEPVTWGSRQFPFSKMLCDVSEDRLIQFQKMKKYKKTKKIQRDYLGFKPRFNPRLDGYLHMDKSGEWI